MDEGSVSHINIHICGAWLPGCVVVGWCIVLVLGYDRPFDGMGFGEVSFTWVIIGITVGRLVSINVPHAPNSCDVMSFVKYPWTYHIFYI